ncbi:hypothetical protein HK096_009150 [Nowakowskiella sp. JEL0078]|nr:hypothetical protein HK096_009150 [Nowakowskiella sp. JEL0078]
MSHVQMLAKELKSAWQNYPGRTVCLTGAGVSTDSGIPSYRGLRGVENKSPITFQAFRGDQAFRDRYWARSFLGYPFIASAVPNSTHKAINSLRLKGFIGTLITQNVDSLHGNNNVLELHGSLREVRCLECDLYVSRDTVQNWLSDQNPEWAEYFSEQMYLESTRTISSGVLHTLGAQTNLSAPTISTLDLSPPKLDKSGHVIGTTFESYASRPIKSLRPDGDVDIDHLLMTGILPPFKSPICPCLRDAGKCGGVLKPDVLFFGESMKMELVEKSKVSVDDAGLLLVVGSTLTVYSAYRIVTRAIAAGVKVVVLNKGLTRADGLEGVLKIDGWSGDVLPDLVDILN